MTVAWQNYDEASLSPGFWAIVTAFKGEARRELL